MGSHEETATVEATAPRREPPALLRATGLATLVVLVVIDAAAADWNPNPMVYVFAVPVVVWGPSVAASLVPRKGD